TPEQVADELQYWHEEVGVDGFNVKEVLRTGSLDDFVDLVVPELRERDLLAEPTPGETLREHLLGDGPRIAADHPARR
ncbi:MAG: 5,10-methylene tetrahydromethanopterin reductase, partial [Salinigranum sp.]